MDNFCFTSGDGRQIFNYIIPRVKGYCSEPSATFLYYFVPSIFGFLLSRPYMLLSIFIILVNIICIGSLSTLIALILTIYIYFVLKLKFRKYLLIISLTSCLFIIGSLNHSEKLILKTIPLLPQVSILSQKVNDSKDSFFYKRSSGIEKGFQYIFSNLWVTVKISEDLVMDFCF